MEAMIEYAIVGVIALAFFYLISPSLLEFYGEASEAVDNATGLSDSESTLVSTILLLTLLLFFLFGAWIMYGSVKDKV